MDVVHGLDLGMGIDGHRVEAAHLAHLDEGGLEARERLHVGLGPHVLVMVEDRQAVDVLHRNDGMLEAALLPGALGPLLALDSISVDIVTREAVFRGDEVRRDALRHEVGFHGDGGVDGPGAA